MQSDFLALPNRRRLIVFSGIYAIVMLYGSTVIGPAGLHFVYRDPITLFRAFLNTPYVHHGSDQRADWVGNMLMLVPFGFLVTRSFWPRQARSKALAVLGALAVCLSTVLIIKYIQLFFPPRTVTLNYILAQSIGAGIGCLAGISWQEQIAPYLRRRDVAGTLIVVLGLYTLAICLFVLMPLDFALNGRDLSTSVGRFPSTLLMLPGRGRPFVVRAAVVAMGAFAFAPVGMLLAFVCDGIYRVRRPVAAVAGWGVFLSTCLYVLSLLVISSSPVLPSVLFRSAGILLGALLLRWLARQNAELIRTRLRALVPWMIPPYLLVLLLVNRLVSTQWESLHFVVVHIYRLGLVPLFDYYIVSKAQAAKNIAGHLILYAPIGVMMWLWYGYRSAARAFATAATLSFAVEVARYFRPGLQGDVNAVALAGVSAMLTVRLMSSAWGIWQSGVRHLAPEPVRRWDKRDSSFISVDMCVGRAYDRGGGTGLPSAEHVGMGPTVEHDPDNPSTGTIEQY